MIVMYNNATTYKAYKPIMCRKCNRGKLGNIPTSSRVVLSKRGKLPSDERSCCLQIKCPSCRELWILTIEE